MVDLGQPKLQISSAFDSGNIEVVGDPASLNAANIQLRIRPDPYCATDEQAHFQWFHYQVTGTYSLALTCKTSVLILRISTCKRPLHLLLALA